MGRREYAFLSKSIFFPSKSMVCFFFQLTYFTDALPPKERNSIIRKWTNHMIDKKIQAVQKSTQAFGKFFGLLFFHLTLKSTF